MTVTISEECRNIPVDSLHGRIGPMDATLVRQAILDTRSQVQGHEIRFRARPEDWFPVEGEEVVESALHTFGLHRLTQGRRAFITVSPSMLLRGFTCHLPPVAVVLQIPPT